MNRGVWRFLEAYERELAKSGKKVKVEIIVDFKGGLQTQTGATILAGYKKTIFKNGKLSECYYFPNVKPTKKTFSEYKILNYN